MSKKAKSIYVCTNCGAESPKWIGKCPACGEWNTYKEEIITPLKQSNAVLTGKETKSKPEILSKIEFEKEKRILTGENELDRVLGGGIVPGSLTLIGGEPGIGKSTLILQTVLRIKNKRILYVSGEESLTQIKLRAERINETNDHAWFVSETSLENIYAHVKNINPDILIIDSIQTIYTENSDTSPGSITQIKDTAVSLLRFAKGTNIPVIIIGHINKDGYIAGPKVLEHIVDVTLLFEGDKQYFYRLLRPIKNRFGNTSEIGIYEMRQNGLREVKNPSEMLLTGNHMGLSGIATAATLEGIRPFLIETQALVSTAAYGTPQRSATGFDIRRLNMLLAVLEKRAGFKLIQKDVFLNIAGGIKVNDPAIDLAVLSAILSSNLDIPIDNGFCLAGEVGLSGEIRPVSRIEQRIAEAQKLGFSKIIIPNISETSININKFDIKSYQVKKVEEAFKILFT